MFNLEVRIEGERDRERERERESICHFVCLGDVNAIDLNSIFNWINQYLFVFFGKDFIFILI
jgi:hypothetical protein